MDRWKTDDITRKTEGQPDSDTSPESLICLHLFIPEIYGYGPESIIWEEFIFSPSSFHDGEFSSLLVKLCEVYQVQKLNNILVEVNSSLLEVYIVVRSFERLRDHGFYIFGSIKTIKKLRRSLLFGKSASSPSRVGAGSAAYLQSLSVTPSKSKKGTQSPDSTKGSSPTSLPSRHGDQYDLQRTPRSSREENPRRTGKPHSEPTDGPSLPCSKCVSGSLGLRHDPECPVLFADHSEGNSEQEEVSVSEVSFRSEMDEKNQAQESFLRSDNGEEEDMGGSGTGTLPLDFGQAMADLQKEFGDPLPYLREGGSGLLPSPSRAQRGHTGQPQTIKPMEIGQPADAAKGPSGYIITEGRLQMMKYGRNNQYTCRFDGCVKYGSQKDGEPFSFHYFGPFVRHMEEKHNVVVLPDSCRVSARRFEVRGSSGKLLGYRCNYLGCKEGSQVVMSHEGFRIHMERGHNLGVDEGGQSSTSTSPMNIHHQMPHHGGGQGGGRPSRPSSEAGDQQMTGSTSGGSGVCHLGEALCRLARDGERPRGGHGGQRAQADSLIQQGADPDYVGTGGDTPLLLAAGYGKLGVALALLDAGADVNKSGRFGDTPLHRACFHLRTDLVRLLLKHGADPKARDYKGQVPGTKFKPRTRPQEEKAVADILQFYQKQQGLGSGRLPMSSLVKEGRYFCLYHARSGNIAGTSRCAKNQVYSQRLIHHMHEVHGKDVFVDAPYKELGEQLLEAARMGQVSQLARLISQGADPNYEAKRSSSASHDNRDGGMIGEGSMGLPDGCTPLLAAVEAGHEAAAQFLLESGANVNKGDRGQRRPIHVACKPPCPRPSLVSLLLDNRARPHLRTRRGHSADDLVRQASGPTADTCLRMILEAQSARRSRNVSGAYTDDDSTTTSAIKSGNISDEDTPPSASATPTAPKRSYSSPTAVSSEKLPVNTSPPELAALSSEPGPSKPGLTIADSNNILTKTLLVRQETPLNCVSAEDGKLKIPSPKASVDQSGSAASISMDISHKSEGSVEMVASISSVDEANKLVSSIFPNLTKTADFMGAEGHEQLGPEMEVVEEVSEKMDGQENNIADVEGPPVEDVEDSMKKEDLLKSPPVKVVVELEEDVHLSVVPDFAPNAGDETEGKEAVEKVVSEDKDASIPDTDIQTEQPPPPTKPKPPTPPPPGLPPPRPLSKNPGLVSAPALATASGAGPAAGRDLTKPSPPAVLVSSPALPVREAPSPPKPPTPAPAKTKLVRSRSSSPASEDGYMPDITCTHCNNKGHSAEVCVLKQPEFSSWEEMAEDSEGPNSADSAVRQSFSLIEEEGLESAGHEPKLVQESIIFEEQDKKEVL